MSKDTKLKTYFEDNRRYADVINGIGCGGRQLIQPSDLQEADSTERKKSRDLLRKVAFGINFVIIGIENQDKVDYKFPLRNMYYDVSRYQKQASVIAKELRENPTGLTSAEYLCRFKKSSRLHPSVTIVLYAGKEEWDGPRSLYDILDFSDIPEELRSMVSDYKINIIDIHRLKDTSVFQTDVRQVFDFIRYSDDKVKLMELVKSDASYRTMEDDAVAVVNEYTNVLALVKAEEEQMEKAKGKKKKTVDICQGLLDLVEDSKAEGRIEGKKEGKKEGIELTRLESAKNLLDLLSDEVISERIQLPLATVQALRMEQNAS